MFKVINADGMTALAKVDDSDGRFFRVTPVFQEINDQLAINKNRA